jgi:large subunit ribosomal protein L21
VYAIVRSGARQEKVAVGDLVTLDRLSAKPGAAVTLPVLLLVDGDTVSTDVVGAVVTAEVLGHSRGPKIDILRYKNKSGYRRRQGHRQELSTVKVTSISAGK